MTSADRQPWNDEYARLLAADRASPLEPAALERLATLAYLLGRDAESAEHWARAHQAFLRSGDPQRAVRCAFWLAFGLLEKGDMARAEAWLARAHRTIDDCGPDCVEHGYLLVPAGIRSIGEGDHAAAEATFAEAVLIGERFGDPDLAALARHGRGRALLRMGRISDGLRLLDEAMVAVEAGELSPVVAGDVYCGVISGCLEVFDVRRAQEWTSALSHWCESHPEMVPYRGQCMVRRAEIMQLHGAWADAMAEARRACERLAEPAGQAGIGAAFYQRGELHRLRGEHAESEQAYREASRAGRKPQPGLALLRLAQGQVDVAAASLRAALDEAADRRARSKLLSAAVEIMLATSDVPAARLAADELARTADDLDAPLLRAAAAHATGAVLLAEGDARAALASARRAWSGWQELDAPYEAARARVLVGLACGRLGDEDTADMELDAARSVFQQLGAAVDLTRWESPGRSRGSNAGSVGRLTDREVQVLRLIASGRTNRAIADQLRISEKTVARHVSNIFTKLGLSSRSAATAWAYEHAVMR